MEYDGVWSSNPGALKNQGSYRNGIEVYGHDASALIATWHGDSFGIIPR